MTRLLATVASVALLLAVCAPAHGQGCGVPTAGDCLVAHATPGCKTGSCCTLVCNFMPDCCMVSWDEGCVELANTQCLGLCGASGNGDCHLVHSTPACNDATCCNAVCAIDPYCCDTEWDASCVMMVPNVCPSGPPVPCGSPTAGSCVSVHPTPSCNNAACCNTVCALDSACCTSQWDSICVQLARAYCSGCSIDCPTGSTEEQETCGQRLNDPCAGAGQAPVPMAPGAILCGQLDGTYVGTTWSGDRDVYAITVPDPDHDGVAKVTIGFAAEFRGFAALVAPGCGVPLSSAVAFVDANGCPEQSKSACVTPGQYWLVVATGTFPAVGLTQSLDCSTTPRYTVHVDVSQYGCTNPCGNPASGACFEPHVAPGCSDSACCAAACTADPFCCSETWDGSCAARAAVLCGAPIPANDDCTGALPIRIGDAIAFNTAVARISTPAIPASCDQGSGTNIGNDLWYVHDATRSGNVVASTCGSATNLRIAVYSGDCTSLALVACSSSSVICTPNTGARAAFVAACGTRYWIRVGGETPGDAGLGTITLAGQGPLCVQPCPADLDGNRVVNGADLGMLLGNWGNAGVGDIDGNGVVNGADLGALLGAYGNCP